MDLSQMRTIVRRDLRDEDSQNYRWSDDELNRHIAHALNELSEAVPYQEKALKATTNSSREIDISSLSDHLTIQAVEYPIDKFPPKYQRFSIWGNLLNIQSDETPDGSNARIYYGTLHILDSQSSTIPSHLEDLLASGVEGYAAVEWAIYATNRVNTGGTNTPDDFLKWGTEKLDYFRQELKRLGQRNRVRLNQLYKPLYPIVSKTTDFGP